ncbi:hypothetical protein [Chondromyces crocatus]|uniref:Uncharacterized protein n=1 Tax=Chondromyces crocatus TaxID=52 RepID=A0A0K1EQM2_CHOCO|nr:hypothetical protein [Chondromyces crocatus]AKT42952.1 uncharacterized protein CMC5_071800 [Chondromyces crocatus]
MDIAGDFVRIPMQRRQARSGETCQISRVDRGVVEPRRALLGGAAGARAPAV